MKTKKYKMTFDSIDKAYKAFCREHYFCETCPLSYKNNSKNLKCNDFKANFPDEAAKLVGLEVVEVFEDVEDVEGVEDGPKLTEQELAICKALGAKWASIDDDGGDVELWDEVPCKGDNGSYSIGYPPSPFGLARIASGLFPSLRPGDLVNVEELLKEAEK